MSQQKAIISTMSEVNSLNSVGISAEVLHIF